MFLAVTLLALTACASSTGAETTTSAQQASTEAAPVPDLSGTWGFVLEQSDVAGPLKAGCKGDPTCWNEIAAQSAKEKIRFAGAAGAVKWTSFETDGKNEKVFLELPLELSSEGPGHVLAKSGDKTIRIDVVDAHTIAMNDPKKGRLVYTKE